MCILVFCVHVCGNDICSCRACNRVRRALDSDGFTDNKLSYGEMRFKVHIRSRVPIPIANLLLTLPDIWYGRSLLTPIKGSRPIVPGSEIISNDTMETLAGIRAPGSLILDREISILHLNSMFELEDHSYIFERRRAEIYFPYM